ncbi:methylated-DNA--[protein]-cysteine S-methyltransferase [Caldichromatium japonicum]|uniref:methylated-DNA--[protein]-cysteine S-methyltransferase n=2 Tax=Caldichromatium japonicum TaxID=2699430 RepID=A0A6G7VGR8_9GAMM|nr:methylated-DNA--[protein]-cysteine S-methyltransferase [Caldichromatium japonicum]
MKPLPADPCGLLTTPLGNLGVRWRGEALVAIDLAPYPNSYGVEPAQPPTAILHQLTDYFCNPQKRFTLPLQLAGTPFRQRLWAILQTIPVGETRSYGELARLLGTSARAVGQACRANPCPIVIPCHRVVGCDGLGGFAGARDGLRLAIKRWLLQHEGALSGGPSPTGILPL